MRATLLVVVLAACAETSEPTATETEETETETEASGPEIVDDTYAVGTWTVERDASTSASCSSAIAVAAESGNGVIREGTADQLTITIDGLAQFICDREGTAIDCSDDNASISFGGVALDLSTGVTLEGSFPEPTSLDGTVSIRITCSDGVGESDCTEFTDANGGDFPCQLGIDLTGSYGS